jgi:DNA-binding GntR family transcriptional regulator
MAEVESGRFPLGTKLPNELELSEQFGASRFTIRAAIERLASEGIVSRRPKVGTIVESIRPRADRELSVGSLEDIQQYGSRTVLHVLHREIIQLDENLPPPLDVHAGEAWLHVKGLRTIPKSDETICYNRVWVSPDYRGVRGVEGTVRQSIWALIELQFGVRMASVKQEMVARGLDAEAAKAMRLKSDCAALYVRRSFYDDRGRLIEVAVSVHPPEVFVYRLNIERHDRKVIKTV